MRAAPSARIVAVAVGVGLVVVWLAGLWYFDPWVAHNDFAVFRLRLERVLGGEPGLLGAHSRLDLSHPGPAREWLFALPYWISGRRAAALPATALVVNLVWVGVGLAIAWRRRERWIGAVTAVGLAVLLVALRDQLDSPWNPHLAILPLFVATSATVLVLDGSTRAWIVATVAASFAGQLHASALVVAASLYVIVLVGEVRATDGRRWWRSIVLGAALWIGPILDLVHGADANLVRLLTTDAGERVGVADALAGVSRLTWPLTPIEAAAIEPGTELLAGWSRWWLVVVAAVLLVGIVRARRDLRFAAVVASVGVVAAVISVAAFVEPPYGYLYGPLQAVAVFAFVTAVAIVAREAVPELPASRPLGVVALGVCVVALVGSIAATSRDDHESAARRELGLERAVDAHLDEHPDWDTVTLVGLDLVAANPVAELADILVRRDLDPRSDRTELDLDPPPGGGDAYVVAMGHPLACLIDAGVEPLTEGTVPSVGARIALFAFDLDAAEELTPCGVPAHPPATEM